MSKLNQLLIFLSLKIVKIKIEIQKFPLQIQNAHF